MAVVQPYTIIQDGITYTITKLTDGTGHGNDATACPIRAERGFTPGDETTTDGYACARDSSTYQVTINVSASSTARTAQLGLLDDGNVKLDSSAGNFCAGTYIGSLHTGKQVYNGITANPSNYSCAMTFAPNVSGQESFTFVVISSDEGVSGPKLVIGTGAAREEVAAQTTTYLAQPTLDVYINKPSQGAAVRNGEPGQLFTFPVSTMNVMFQRDLGGVNHKGMPDYSKYTEHSVANVDVSMYPAGTIFYLNGVATTPVNGILTIDYSGTNARNPGTTIQIGTFEAFIPRTVVNTMTLPKYTYQPHIVSTNVTLTHNTSGLVLHNFAGMTSGVLLQPGEGQPFNYQTRGTTGYLAQGGHLVGTNGNFIPGTQLPMNNDWAQVDFYPGPSGATTGKQMLNLDGTPVGGNWIRVETPYWAKITMTSALYTSSKLEVCDRWYNDPTTVGTQGPQFYDATRAPIVKVLAADGTWVDQPYEVWYADLGTNPQTQGCGNPQDFTGWSQDISTINGGNPDAVRFVLTDVDMSRSGTLEFLDVRIPFKLGTVDNYGVIKGDTYHHQVQDWAKFQADPAATTFRDGPQAQVIATIPRPTIDGTPWWTQPNTGSPLTSVSAGSNLDMRWIEVPTIQNATSTDNRWGTVQSTVTLDSCVIVDEAKVLVIGQNSDYVEAGRGITQIEAADYGPDGIPCTNDDVKGATLQLDPNHFEYPSPGKAMNTGHNYFGVTLVPWAPPGSNLDATLVTTYTLDTGQVATKSKTTSVPIVSPTALGQFKTATETREPVGNQIGWDVTFFNQKDAAIGASRFIDVLPHPGDSVGSTITAPLTNFTVSTFGTGISLANVYVTSADPATIVRDANDASNWTGTAPTPMWCLYGDTTCLGGKEITAIYVSVPGMAAHSVFGLHVKADTAGQTPRETTAVNQLGTARMGADTIGKSVARTTTLFRTEPAIETDVFDYKDPAFGYTTPNGAVEKTVGDVIDYTIRVKNTGFVDITDVAIDDPNITACEIVADGATTGTKATLPTTIPYGATLYCYGSHTVTEADVIAGEVVTTATATGLSSFDPTVTVTDPGSATTPTPAVPKADFTKAQALTTDANGDGKYDAGDVVTYTYTVTNSGNITLGSIAVADTKPAFTGAGDLSAVSCMATTLAPGASTTCTATYTIVQADVDAAKDVVNTATLSATPTGGTAITPAPTATATWTPAAPAPALTLAKSVTTPADVATKLAAGDTVTYTFEILNSGNQTVSNIAIDESQFEGGRVLGAITCSEPAGFDGTLAPGEKAVCTADYTATQADVDAALPVTNTATVNGTSPAGTPVTATDDATFNPVDLAPAVAIEKTNTLTTDNGTAGVYDAGDVVEYAVKVTNTGNATLTNVVVADTAFTGKGAAPLLTRCVADGVETAVSPAAASTTLASLAPGKSVTCYATYTVVQGDVDAQAAVTNMATVDATDPKGNPQSANDSDTWTPATAAPAIELVTDVAIKTDTGAAGVTVGDTMEYTFTVTNTGNTSLNGVAIAPPTFDGDGPVPTVTCPETTVAPGESIVCTATYVVTQPDIDAQALVTLDATVSATSPQNAPVEASDDATWTPIAATPQISVAKSHALTTDLNNDGAAGVGDKVTYTVTVINGGTVTLNSVTATETEFTGGPLPTLTCPATTLAPGATMDCTATWVVTQAAVDAGQSVTNKVDASGTPVSGSPVTANATDSLVLETPAPAITLVGTATDASGDGVVSAGETVTYTFTATNTGNQTLSNTAITLGDFAGTGTLGTPTCTTDGTVAVGATYTCTVTYVATQADIDAGTALTLPATVNATSPAATPVTADATATIDPVAADPSVALDVVADAPADGSWDAGDTVTFTYTVTNDGNTTLTNPTVSGDTFAGAGTRPAITCPDTTELAPGETMVCTGTYQLVQADIDNATNVVENASATATPPSGPAVTDTGSASITPATANSVLGSSSSAALKDPADTSVDAGDVVVFTITGTNEGNTTLTGLATTVDGFNGTGTYGDPVCPDPTTLLPGQDFTCTVEYTVTQADVDAGTNLTLNTTVTANPPAGEPLTQTETPSIQVKPAVPAVTIDVAHAAPADGTWDLGDVVEYTYTVTNSGTATLTNPVVESSAFTGSGTAPEPTCTTVDPLAPVATMTCTATYTVTQADIDAGVDVVETGKVTATAPTGVTPASVSATDDDAFAPAVQKPAIDVQVVPSTPADTRWDAGDEGTFTFTVTNIGNATLTDPALTQVSHTGTGTVTDIQCPNPPTSLAPGASYTCTATYTVTQEDINNNTPVAPLTENVSVSAMSPSNVEVTDTGSADITPATQAPSVTMTNTPSVTADANGNGKADAGDTVTYEMVVTNSGNTTLTNVELGALVSPGTGTLGTVTCTPEQPSALDPGQSMTCTVDYKVTQGDIDAGTPLDLPATVTTVSPDGTNPEASDTGSIYPAVANSVLGSSSSAALKDPADNEVNAGDVVVFTITGTNNGNTTLTGLATTVDGFNGSGSYGDPVCPDPTTLLPGQDFTCTVEYTVTQTDIDNGTNLTLDATITANPPAGEPLTQTVHPAIQVADAAPSVAIEVTHAAPADDAWDLGDVVEYTYTVTNNGNVTLTNPVVETFAFTGLGMDPEPNCTIVDPLAPGATMTCTATYTVTQADIDAGADVVLTGKVTAATPPGVTPASVSDSDDDAFAPAVKDPSIDVQVEPSTEPVGGWKAGDTVEYTITVTNNGNATLTDPTLTQGDHTGAGTDPVIVCEEPDTLAPGASYTCTVTYTVTQEDINNNLAGTPLTENVSVSANPPAGDPVTDNDSADITLATQAPSVTMTNTATLTNDLDGNTKPGVGDEVNYSIVVTNDGNTTLTDVQLADLVNPGTGELGTLACDPTAPSTLQPGESMTCEVVYTVAQGDIDAGAPLALPATVTAVAPDGSAPDASATGSIQPDDQVPALSSSTTITNTNPDDLTVDAGDTVRITITGTNEGNTTLTDVQALVDQFNGSGERGELSCDPAAPAVLAPGATITCTVDYTVTQADIDAGADLTAMATVTGTPPVGAPLESESSHSIGLADRAPSIGITVTHEVPADGQYNAGDVVEYIYLVTNTGNTTLTNPAVSSANTGAGEGPTPVCETIDPLRPGVSYTCTGTYTVTQADIDNGLDVVETGTVVANTPTGMDPETVTASAKDPFSPAAQEPKIDVQVSTNTPADGTWDVGDEVTYTFTVSNPGNATLTDPTLTQGIHTGLGDDVVITCTEPDTLAPGESYTCTATYVVTQEDLNAGTPVIENVSVSANPPVGDPVTDDGSNTITLAPQDPKVGLTASTSEPEDGTWDLGDVATLTYTVTNTGNTTLDDVQLADLVNPGTGELGTLVCDPTAPSTLQPGESMTCTVEYTIGQGDVDMGKLLEFPTTVSSVAPDGSTATDEASTSLTAEQGTPKLTPSSTATPKDLADTTVDAGDVVVFTITGTNDGTTSLTDLQAKVDAFNGSGELGTMVCTPESKTLLPGEAFTCTIEYTVTQKDIDNGVPLELTSSITATPPVGTPITETTTSSIELAEANGVVTLDVTASEPADGAWNVGDVVEYTFVVKNEGNVTLNDLAINTDSFTGAGAEPIITCQPASMFARLAAVVAPSLAPGGEMVCTASYTLVQEDIDAGTPITETATVTATSDADPTIDPATDSATINPADQAPALSSDSSSALTGDEDGDGVVDAGDKVTFTITGTNDGNTTLEDLKATIDAFNGSGELGNLVCPDPTTLAPGETFTCTVEYTVTQEDIDNGTDLKVDVTLTATPPTGDLLTDSTSTTIPVAPAEPVLSSESSSALTGDQDGNGAVDKGDTVTFTITGTNDGNVSLSDLQATVDAFNGSGQLGELVCPDPTTLAPGETFTCTVEYTVTQEDIDNGTDLKLDVTLTGTTPAGDPVSTSTSTSIPLSEAIPVLTADSSTELADDLDGDGVVDAGDKVIFTITGTNDGTSSLTDLQATIDAFNGSGELGELVCPDPTTLAPGETFTCTIEYTVTQADIDNGTDLKVDVTLTATPPTGDPITDSTSATIPVAEEDPQLTLDVTANPADDGSYDAGDQVTFTYVFKNTGNVTLTNVGLVSDSFNGAGDDLTLTCPIPMAKAGGMAPMMDATSLTLAPGVSVECTATYTLVQADIDGGVDLVETATVSGESPAGTTATATDDAAITPADAVGGITVESGVELTGDQDGNGKADAGDTMTYTFVVTNDGTVTLNGVAIDVDSFSGSGDAPVITCPATTLAPGESMVCTATYVVTEADAAAGVPVTLNATTTATLPNGETVSDESIVSFTPEKPAPAPTPTPTPTKPSIPATGVDVNGLLPASAILTTIGVGLLLAVRRRKADA